MGVFPPCGSGAENIREDANTQTGHTEHQSQFHQPSNFLRMRVTLIFMGGKNLFYLFRGPIRILMSVSIIALSAEVEEFHLM